MKPTSYYDIRCFVNRALSERDRPGVPQTSRPSECWKACASYFAYVRDLPDEQLKNIRHHTYHLTFDTYLPYLVASDKRQQDLKAAHDSLAQELGGFRGDEGETGIGIDVGAWKVSEDLIRYLQVMTDLRAAGVLERDRQQRFLEIGGGYGGLASVLMAYNSQATYIATDLEETLFFQAVHLSNRFGFLSLELIDDDLPPTDQLEAGRFYLVPQVRSGLLTGVRVDLAINQQSMQEMSEAQVKNYCSLIKNVSRFFYSRNRQEHEGAVAVGMKTVQNLTALLDSSFPKVIWRPPGTTCTHLGDAALPRRLYACSATDDLAASFVRESTDDQEDFNASGGGRIASDAVGGTSPQTTRAPCCLDLGCGTLPLPGFLGVDRYPLEGVSVVADLNRLPLPFRDGVADAVYACHSLEHVDDLLGAMNEISRIAKPGARVVIVVPYGGNGLNLANPYYKQFFNEHSPRFWTNAADSPVPAVEYRHPPSGLNWGLSLSDHSDSRLDLRCVRIEFLYFDEYRNLPPGQQRYLRRKHNDVCDQIIYELVVHKSDYRGDSAVPADFPLPSWLEARRGPLRRPLKGRAGRLWRALRTRLHP